MLSDKNFLIFIWKNRLFETDNLRMSDGTPIEILSTGFPSSAAEGMPDFCRVSFRHRGSQMVHHGNIKIDCMSSDWRKNNRHDSGLLSSVILHVVTCSDTIIFTGGREIPTLVIEPYEEVIAYFNGLVSSSPMGVPCLDFFSSLDELHRNQILTRIMSDRMQRKVSDFIKILGSVDGDWHEATYIHFIRSFGFRNKDAFEMLARSVPYRYIRMYGESLSNIEALLLGQAGYLNVNKPDSYTQRLQDEYISINRRHNILPPPLNWQSAAVRPSSMPVQLIVKIAAILEREESLLERVIGSQSIEELISVFEVPISEYWQTHFAPSHQMSTTSRSISEDKINLLIINFAIPLLNAYGRETGNDMLADLAVDLYAQLPSEDNKYIRHWCSHGVCATDAFFSQAVIQLSTEYCGQSRCGSCPLALEQLIRVKRERIKINIDVEKNDDRRPFL